MTSYDAVVVGGGFFGARLALFLKATRDRVLLLEAASDLLTRASFANQARVHNGYHYPRSVLTALRSRVNFGQFVGEYGECVEREFDAYYAVARAQSKLTAAQFAAFCARIGAPARPAPAHVRRLFDARLIESVFEVREYAFDAVRLRARLWRDLDAAGVDVRCDTRADRVFAEGGQLAVAATHTSGATSSPLVARAPEVFQSTYSATNCVLRDSGLPTIPLTHELAELTLVEVPEPLRHAAVTVVDGPFFSLMPFPSAGLHSFTHVRYTPHAEWRDDAGDDRPRQAPPLGGDSGFAYMQKDAQRYLPALAGLRYVRSLWEVKTILPRSAADDSRPILLRRDHALPGFSCVLGGKIDNVYDALAELGQPRTAHAHAG